ncbi:acid phosphatase type 7 [Tetranychus urticae]|uniref:Purple acid phosphatase n=1 Tax=Tetranychus urticae TaxID=32264 RepID=T1JVC5_TETUR|nr:acid phosphatase type 7 [Tetranychus urticae]
MNLFDYMMCFFVSNCIRPMPEGPHQVHLSLNDEATSITVSWTDLKPFQEPTVKWGLERDQLSNQSGGHLRRFGSFGRDIFSYWAVMRNLEPDTTYYYQVGSKSRLSPVYSFRTLPSGTNWSPRIAIFGDLGLKNGQAIPVLNNRSVSGDFDLVAHIGDIAYDLYSSHGIIGDEFMQAIEPMTSSVPYMVVPGNHEYLPIIGDSGVAYKYRYKMPGESNDMYTFTVGPILFITISTEFYYYLEGGGAKKVAEQRDWLENVLTEANQPENRAKHPWIIVLGHRPFYCSSSRFGRCPGGTTWIRTGSNYLGKGLEDLFYKGGVDLVFGGHNHQYERMYPVYDLKISGSSTPYLNPNATTYIISGSAGNQEDLDGFKEDPPVWSAFRNSEYSYTQLTAFNSTHLMLQQISVPSETVIDSVIITQRNHRPFDQP